MEKYEKSAMSMSELPLEDINTSVDITLKEKQEKAFIKFFSTLDYDKQERLFNTIKGLVYSDKLLTDL
jgi:hypothetical protein